MPAVSIINTTAAQWGVFVQMRGVLLSAGAQRLPEQASRGRHARSDRALPGQSWPGAGAGVRGPGIDETPLSWAEVQHGRMRGLL